MSPPLPTLDTFARRPRDALMWIPRAIDLARIRAALAAAGPRVIDVGARSRSEGADVDDERPQARVIDVGAGTGLLAHLLDANVEAVDTAPPRVRYHDVGSHAGQATYDAAIVSWMEAGQDYRADVARLAPVIVNAYDVEGGCGVMGQVDFAPFGFAEAASWRTASFEDAAYALDHRGALRRRGWPGNRIDVLTRDPALAAPLARAVASVRDGGAPLPWEAEMDRLRL